MNLDELRALVAVVDEGSLASAAKALRFPIASLRRRLDELEARMGVKLLDRSQIGASPTDAGRVLAERARGVLAEVNALTEVVRQTGNDLGGEVVIAMPPGAPPQLVTSFLFTMTELYPSVVWRVRTSDQPTRELSGSAHAAVSLSQRPPEGPWVSTRLLTMPERLLAAPAYLTRFGTPASLEDLARHRLLSWEGPDRSGHELTLADGARHPITPWLCMTDAFLLRRCGADGLGIMYAPDEPTFSADEGMVPVLDEVVRGTIHLWLSTTPAVMALPRIRVALDQLRRLMSDLRE